MPTLTQSFRARSFTLCALYCAQGMPWGFVTVTLLAYLGERGLSLEDTAGIISLATLPWSFKFVWGVVIDRFTFRPMGRRRPWVLVAQLGAGITLLAMILQGDISDDVQLLAWMVFVHNCFVSLQDVASDALAIDVLRPEERGRVNGLMWGSNYLGVAIGGAGMGTVLGRFGIHAAFVLQASVLLAIALLPLLIKERPGERLFPWSRGDAESDGDAEPAERMSVLVRRLAQAFLAKSPLLGLLYGSASFLMIGIMATIHPVFCTQVVGWSQERYSQVDGGLSSGAGIVGALVGGFLVDRLGVGRIVTLAALGVVALCATMSLSESLRTNGSFVMFYLPAMAFLTSAQTVAGFSLFMRLCSAVVAGTQFTLFMAATNFARVGGARVVEGLADQGYATLFRAMAISSLVALPFLYGCLATAPAVAAISEDELPPVAPDPAPD
ncbi:MAG: MFS transporter [Planctomycetota bacterium]|nr:MAG: MFS transporter [Planctomycetota bacterium]